MKRKLSILLILAAGFLAACAPTMLEQGKSNFQQHQYSSAFQQLYPLANQGDSDAQYAIGYMLYYGKGAIRDQEAGLSWMHRAALQGNPLAEQALGIIYSQANFAPERSGMSN